MLVKRLLEGEVQANAMFEGTPLLLHAAREGQFEVVRLLIQHQASVNERGRARGTALHYACQYGATDMAKDLISAGISLEAQITELDDSYSMTPFMVAVAHRRTDIVHLLLERRAKVDTVDVFGRNALHHACERYDGMESCNAKIWRELLAAGADVDRRDVGNQTSLMYACRTKSTLLALILLLWALKSMPKRTPD